MPLKKPDRGNASGFSFWCAMYTETISDNEDCPRCKNRAPRVSSQLNDAQGRHDEYVCDVCLLFWPTEWSDKYKKREKEQQTIERQASV